MIGKNDGETWNAMDIGHHLSIQTAVLEAILIDMGSDKGSSAEHIYNYMKGPIT